MKLLLKLKLRKVVLVHAMGYVQQLVIVDVKVDVGKLVRVVVQGNVVEIAREVAVLIVLKNVVVDVLVGVLMNVQ